MATEAELQIQVADYLRLRYPKVLFHSDFGAGVKLTMGQAIRQKRQNGGRRAWPDLFIAEPSYALDSAGRIIGFEYFGLFIELKREGTRIYRKDGSFVANAHILEQEHLMHDLRKRGYKAEFAVGFDEAKKLIDDYVGGRLA